MKLFSSITEVISGFISETLPEERKAILQPLIDYIQLKKDMGEQIRLNFICTHNSRRSHLSQVWAQTLAHHFGVDKVFSYSGGTEATAMFPMVVETLKGQGFRIKNLSEGNNPVYAVQYSENAHPVIGFSKTFDDEFNPKSGFAAVMTCSHADENCPFIPGAEKRIPVTFEDPKAVDNTPQQAEKYRERSLQIATDLYYVFSQIR